MKYSFKIFGVLFGFLLIFSCAKEEVIPIVKITPIDIAGNEKVNKVYKKGDRLFAVGDSALFYFSNDNGESWTKKDLGISSDDDLKKIFFLNDDIWFLYGTILLKTKNAGSNWEVVDNDGGKLVQFFDENRGYKYSGGNYHYFYETNDGGKTWQQAFTKHVSDFYFINPDTGIVINENGKLEATLDVDYVSGIFGGSTDYTEWSSDHIKVTGDTYGRSALEISFESNNKGYLLMDEAAIGISKDGIWDWEITPTDFILSPRSFTKSGDIILIGGLAFLILSEDNGQSWKFLRSEEGINLDGIFNELVLIDESTAIGITNSEGLVKIKF